MSLFRHRNRPSSPPQSPKEVFDRLPPSTIKFLWAHQDAALANYLKASDKRDVAVELPTGSGKTLVGLLIAEFQRLKNQKRVAYLCPTRQLAYQTQARAKSYGIDAVCLVGPKAEYDQASLSAYERGGAVAITTYSSLFNIKPGLGSPETIIFDDAHAGESFVSDMWSLHVSVDDDETLFHQLIGFFGEAIRPEISRAAANTKLRDVDLVPLPRYFERLHALQELLNDYCMRSDTLRYSWMAIKGHLPACAVYVSPGTFLVRPLAPPTQMHPAFAEAAHRIYMSATLGEDGDLERLFGIQRIHAIKSADLKEANSGRRLILFPELMQPDAAQVVRDGVAHAGDRVLAIVSGGPKLARSVKKFLKQQGLQVLEAKDIEEDLQGFTEEPSAALLLTNRYDGIDLPGDECRRLLLVGVPGALNLQEQFLRDRLGAHAVMRNRIRVRLTQAMGRCTRDKNDYALVLCDGKELKSWCTPTANTEGLGAELRAELQFGLDQSEGSDRLGMPKETAEAVMEAFFAQSVDWTDDADVDIRERAKELKKVPNQTAKELAASVADEMAYVYALWREDYAEALTRAVAVVDTLQGKALQPYRAFWEYLAAVAADGAHHSSGDTKYRTAFVKHVKSAAATSSGVRWLASLAFAHPGIVVTDGVPLGVETVCELLATDWGLRGPQFQKCIEAAKKQIGSDEADTFHSGLEVLGRMLGFRAKRYTADAAPDCVWYSDDGYRYLFEAKTDSKPKTGIPFKTVRQARMHPDWVEENDAELPPARVTEILIVTPQTSIDKSATSISDKIRCVQTASIRQLFGDVSEALTQLRGTARGMGEEELYDHVLDGYHKAGISGEALRSRLMGRELRTLPQV